MRLRAKYMVQSKDHWLSEELEIIKEIRAGCLEEAAIQTDPHRDGICGPGERAQLQRWRLELKLGSATCLPWN